MANRGGYVERDRHGRERLVVTVNPRSSSRNRLSTRELLRAAEEREAVLTARNHHIETQLSWSQAGECRLQNECDHLAAELKTQVDVTKQLQALLSEEKDKSASLEGRLRLMQRNSHDTYRQKYEEVLAEAEDLREGLRERDEMIRLNGLRLEKKAQMVLDLKEHLRLLGYRVVVD
jgi:hypothetical protein